MNNLKKILIIFLIGLSFYCHTQTPNKEKKPLIEVLKQLEIRFTIRFSYADDTLKNIVVSSNQNLSLNHILDDLRLKTGLEFNQLSDRFFSIERPKDFKKEPTLQRLDEIFIQNYLTKGISKTINGGLKISPQQFGILPGLSEPDILQTIQTLPGITSVDERISNINIRGGTNDQNLILYEGIRMYQTGHFFGLISAFNPYLVKNVDVTINGTKAKYGSGVSSVISIENSNKISSTSNSGAGFNLLSFDGFSKFQLSKKTELQIAARRSFTDALLTPTYDTYFERIFSNSELDEDQNLRPNLQQNERFFFYDTSIKFLYDINKNSKIRSNFITIFNRLNYDETPLNADTRQQATKSELSQKSYAGNINFSHEFSESLRMDAQVYFSNYELFGNSLVTSTEQELTQENDVLDIGARLDFLKSIDKNLNLNFGYQFNEVGVSNLEDVSIPRFRRLIKEVVKTHGIYTEAEFTSPKKQTFVRVGLRGNYFEKFGNVLFEPRFVLSQKLLNHFKIELLGEVKSQSITQIIDLQQDFFGIEKRRWQLANNNEVPIVKSNQISLGLNYKNKGWLISVDGYTKNVNDINSRSQGFQNQFQLLNAVGNYSIKGVDFLLNKQFKNLSTWLSYSYSKNDFEFEDLDTVSAFPNNLDIRHVINLSTAYTIENLNLSAGLNWHSGRPFTAPADVQLDSGTIIYETSNMERIPEYMRVDISARYNFQFAENVHAEVGASIWNILNKENTINRFYTRGTDDNIVQNDEFALGLTPNFSFRLKF